jgi:hypothetical protein
MSYLQQVTYELFLHLKYSRQPNDILSFCVQKGECIAGNYRVSLKDNRGQ